MGDICFCAATIATYAPAEACSRQIAGPMPSCRPGQAQPVGEPCPPAFRWDPIRPVQASL